MDKFEDNRQFSEGLQHARSLMSKLNILSLRMLAHSDQMEAASQKLIAGNLKLQSAVDKLRTTANRMSQNEIENPFQD